MEKRLLVFAVLLVSAFYTISAADYYDDAFIAISPVSSALGGPHVTMNDGFSTLMNNPASFYSAESEFSIAELTLGLKGPVFDIANMILEGNLDDIPDILQGIYAGLDVLGPLSFGYIGEGLGFGIYSNSFSKITSSGPLTVEAEAGSEIVLVGGYALRIPLPLPADHSLDAGMLLKGTFTGEIAFEESALNLLNIDFNSIANETFYFTTGIGMDLGLRYSIMDRLVFGLVGRDIYSPTLRSEYANFSEFTSGNSPVDTLNGLVPFALDIGIMYSPDFESKNLFISDMKIYLDYYDMLDFWLYPETAVNPWLHLGIGSEISLLDILAVRAGFNEGLFAAGLGLDLHYFTMNAAMFGTEQSTEPGLQPVYNLQVSFEFRL